MIKLHHCYAQSLREVGVYSQHSLLVAPYVTQYHENAIVPLHTAQRCRYDLPEACDFFHGVDVIEVLAAQELHDVPLGETDYVT